MDRRCHETSSDYFQERYVGPFSRKIFQGEARADGKHPNIKDAKVFCSVKV
jgi:hypothetical protein